MAWGQWAPQEVSRVGLRQEPGGPCPGSGPSYHLTPSDKAPHWARPQRENGPCRKSQLSTTHDGLPQSGAVP